MKLLRNMWAWIVRNGFCFPYAVLGLFYTAISEPFLLVRGKVSVFVFAAIIFMFCFVAGVAILKRMQGIVRLIVLSMLLAFATAYTWASASMYAGLRESFWLYGTLTAVGIATAMVILDHALRRLDSRVICRWTVLCLLIAPLFYIVRDDPAIGNDFHAVDVGCNWPGADESQKIMLTFKRGDGSLRSGLHYIDPVQTNLLPYAEAVEKAWQNIEQGRVVIRKLNTFDRIADVAYPGWITFTGTNYQFVNYADYRAIAQTYMAYGQLRMEQGRAKEGASALAELHSVACKALPDMMLLVTKMMWMNIVNDDIKRAYTMASDPRCSREALQVLKDGFPPLSKESASLRRPMTASYVMNREFVRSLRNGVCRLDDYPGWGYEWGLMSKIPAWGWRIIILPNATANIGRNWLDPLLKEPPDIRRAEEYMNSVVADQRVRNIGGWMFSLMTTPGVSRSIPWSLECRVRSELLAVYLAERLGETLVLNDPNTGKPYGRDARGVPFSVGKDGKAGTADDITLTQAL